MTREQWYGCAFLAQLMLRYSTAPGDVRSVSTGSDDALLDFLLIPSSSPMVILSLCVRGLRRSSIFSKRARNGTLSR